MQLTNYPRLLLPVCLILFALAARGGVLLRVRRNRMRGEEPPRENLDLIITATLTLLGLIVGFTFSMATTRYDQRRLYEEQEANAIGTEYLRVALLPAAQIAPAQALLRHYLDERILFYEAAYQSQVPQIDRDTADTQAQLWLAVQPQAAAAPNPVTALVVSGMNDVLNSQGYTQFAWWNRIPTAAWVLVIFIALFSNLLVGYASRASRDRNALLLVLPLLIAVSLFLVADIDSPRGGVIRIHPQNLRSLAASINQR